MPCLRRATSLAYTEDTERLLSFAEGSSAAADGDEWVETHAGRTGAPQSGDHHEVAEIPDIDGPGEGDDLAAGVGSLSLGSKEPEVIDLDEIPDMEEDDLEDGDEATAAPKAPAAVVPPKAALSAPRFVYSGIPGFQARNP